MKSAKCALLVLPFLVARPLLAGDSPREILDKAMAYVAKAPCVQRVDTSEQSSALVSDKTHMPLPAQKTEVTIEIEPGKQLARQIATVQGQELVMIKSRDRAAMKLGSGNWEKPSGTYATMAQDMGNLFVCEIETPETAKNAPKWKLVGVETLDGEEALVIETEGNSAVAIAQERTTKGIEKVFAGNADAPKMKVTVLEYSAKHWIRKSDYRHLQAVQKSKMQVALSLPTGGEQTIEQTLANTSKYSYEKAAIEIPEAAQAVLAKD